LQRTADTTITVHDGQTVVIGGLINESYEHFIEKVPFFGDIPLLGFLFRSENTVLVRNELVIVITPHVIRSPADLDRVNALTKAEVGRMNLPSSMLDQISAGRLERESLFIREDGVLKVKDLSVEEADEDVSP
jgi:type II secretory pathway component GspD/PulD (secretin)